MTYIRPLFIAIAASILPGTIYASDFALLQVGFGLLVIVVLIIIFGIIAAMVSQREKAIGFVILVIVSAVLGMAIVSTEADHMASGDYYGMLLAILLPGVISLIVPIFKLVKGRYKIE